MILRLSVLCVRARISATRLYQDQPSREASDEHLGLLGLNLPIYCITSLVNHRRKERGKEMTVTRHSEGIEISDIIGGYRVSELYIGYTIKEARRIFREKHLTR